MSVRVLDHGFVRLDGVMASDLSVVNSARVSFGQSRQLLDEADKRLIHFLMRERHGTPFEHNAFRFHVKSPIFVAREWFRHRIGSFNELSGRYKVLDPVGYVPDPEQVRTQVGKPGAYTFEPLSDIRSEEVSDMIEEAYGKAFTTYRDLLDLDVAKEMARMVLPVGIYTEFYWTVNARSLMNFLSLRNSSYAQYEIRCFAEAVEPFFQEHMPVTYAAWVNNNKVAP